MLDEDEFAEIRELYSKAFRFGQGTPEERFQPMLDAYERITGFRETVPAAIMHHRIADFGPPCSNCGKPLRTPQAAFCAACGQQSEVHPVR